MERPKASRKRHCFVPGCKTGYRSCTAKVSLFAVPKNPELLRTWNRLIPRDDMPLDENCVVCALHFDPSFIETHYKCVIEGKEVLTPRGRPLLKSDAIPTIFPGLPKYLSKSLPKKRSRQTYHNESLNKKMKLDTDTSIFEEGSSNSPKPAISLVDICDIQLPSELWVKVKYEKSANVVSFMTWQTYEAKQSDPDKNVTVEVLPRAIKCQSFIKGILFSSEEITSREELLNILAKVNSQGICNGIGCVEEFSEVTNYLKRKTTSINIDKNPLRSTQCSGSASQTGSVCIKCKAQRKILLTQKSRLKNFSQKRSKASKSKPTFAKVRRLQVKAICLQQKLKNIKLKHKMLKPEEALKAQMGRLSHRQKLAFDECLKASARKSTNGMKYNQEWMLECIIMRMKSPRLYEHMRLNKVLVLPSRSCIQKYVSNYQSGFGFNSKTFEILKEKLEHMDPFKRHGCLLFDEMKLAENLQLQASGMIQGYVDYGNFTPIHQKHVMCNHGLVLMFQPFVGNWTQILGVFASNGNVKGELLGKILIEAVILAEDSGLFIDGLTGDGASWNRSMWRTFGIGVLRSGEVKCKVTHPVDPQRELHFLSDFPHLVKCIRNSLIKSGFNTVNGEVRIEFIKAAWAEDQKKVSLRAMPKITKVHLEPNNFEKMRVSLAFQLFSLEVLKGLHLYTDTITAYGNPIATISFIRRMARLIDIMTSRAYGCGLRYNSSKTAILEDFLEYLNAWEMYAGSEGGFISASTNTGLQVTITATLSILKFLTEKIGYSYIFTCRLSQDKIENLFGIIRNCKGCNDHPTAAEFLTIIEMLSFCNLARPPRGANAEPAVVKSLMQISLQTKSESLSSLVDAALDSGSLTEAVTILSQHSAKNQPSHTALIEEHSDARLIFYITGYVVRAFQKKTSCQECNNLLKQHGTSPDSVAASFTTAFDYGGLIFPSSEMVLLITTLENKFTSCFSFNELHRESIMDMILSLSDSTLQFVGCEEHKEALTRRIIKYYIMTRLHFYIKQKNRNQPSKREKQKFLKLRRCN